MPTRNLYCAPNCSRVGPHKTCIVGLGEAMAADTRRDTPIVLARGVIRACRETDGTVHVSAAKASIQITLWRRDAAAADDSAVVDAIDLLGVEEAAKVYAAQAGRALQLDASEKTRLARAAEKARAR